MIGHGLQQRLHQQDIDHRAFVHHEQVALERVVLVAAEAEGLGIDLQQPVNGLGLHAGGLRHALGGPARGRAQPECHGLGLQDPQNGLDDGGLAHTRTAGDHRRLRAQREAHGFGLTVGQGQAGAGLGPGQRLGRVDFRPGQGSAGHTAQVSSDRPFGMIEPAQKDAPGAGHAVGGHGLRGQFHLQRRGDEIFRHVEQLHRKRVQLRSGQSAMAIAHGLGQRERDPGAHPDHRGLLDAESFRDQIGGTEADAPDVAGQPVGVLAHDLHGIGAVGLEDAHRAGRANVVLVQEHHDLADPLLVRPGRGDPVGPLRTDPLDLAQTRRTGLDDVEDVRAEQADHTRGIDRADAPDHAGAEIFFDAFHRRGGGGFQETHAELQPVRPVVGPFA